MLFYTNLFITTCFLTNDDKSQTDVSLNLVDSRSLVCVCHLLVTDKNHYFKTTCQAPSTLTIKLLQNGNYSTLETKKAGKGYRIHNLRL